MFIVGSCLGIAGMEWSTAIWYISSILLPLQGTFSFLAFLHPKIVSAKRKEHNNIGYCTAIQMVFWSRGHEVGCSSSITSQSRSHARTGDDVEAEEEKAEVQADLESGGQEDKL